MNPSPSDKAENEKFIDNSETDHICDEIYEDGPLRGRASILVLIGSRETEWLKHAAEQTGYSLNELVRISAEEAALEYAKSNKLL